MTTGHFERTGIKVAVCLLAVIAALTPAPSQSQEPSRAAALQPVVHGCVRDPDGRPLANATVFLQLVAGPASDTQVTQTDSEGTYRFVALREGAYTLRAELKGYDRTVPGPVSLASKETKQVDLVLLSSKASPAQYAASRTATAGKPAAQAPAFFDEPQFTVAGVTEATNSGGHGSDIVLRTTEALAKATVSLSKEPSGGSSAISAASEISLRDAVKRNPQDPELHHQLADIEEKLGNPLDAVREYQRAAELDPSEPNLFDWGTELLTHRALEPATQVFTQGQRLFPKSARMLIALGVACYARGSDDQAAQFLADASDIDPSNPTPYLFLGKMQSVESTPSPASVERLARFAQLQPQNPLANYYYAVSLWKQSASAAAPEHHAEQSAQVESLLQRAVHLDPKFSAAYLQLGILYSQRADFPQAISALKNAVETGPGLDDILEEAHYRLAQAYLRTGDKIDAQQELQLHTKIAKKIKEDTTRARREIQEFIISLRNKDSGSPAQP